MQSATRTPFKIGDRVGNGEVVGILRSEADGSQLLEISTGRIDIFGVVEINTVWDNEL